MTYVWKCKRSYSSIAWRMCGYEWSARERTVMLHHVCVDVPMTLLSDPHPTPPHAHPPIPPPNVMLIVWCKKMTTVASLSDARRQEAYRSAKDVGKQKNWQRWIRRIPCLIKRGTRPNKYMTNNMARQREQSQDKPAWEPLNTTWPQKP